MPSCLCFSSPKVAALQAAGITHKLDVQILLKLAIPGLQLGEGMTTDDLAQDLKTLPLQASIAIFRGNQMRDGTPFTVHCSLHPTELNNILNKLMYRITFGSTCQVEKT